MRISTDNGNDILIFSRPNGGITIEQGRSHILLNPQELRLLLDALNECVQDFQPSPRIQRYINGAEQF